MPGIDYGPVTPELALVDPVLREQLLRDESRNRIDDEQVGALGEPASAAGAAMRSRAGPARAPGRVGRRFPAALAAGAVATLCVAIPSLAFLPPRQAPRLVTTEWSPARVTWTVDPGANYYVLEVLSGGRLARVAYVRSPPVTLDGLAPGPYTWRIFSGYGTVARRDTLGPIAAGKVVVRASAPQS